MANAQWIKTITGCILCLIIFVSGAEAGNEKWQIIGFTRYRDPLYVDLNRTEPKKESVLNTWIRITPAENSLFRGQLSRDLQRTGKTAQAVKYLEMNKEIDCSHNRIRHLKLIYYDHRERVLLTTGNPSAPWKPILAGSLWTDLRKAVCSGK